MEILGLTLVAGFAVAYITEVLGVMLRPFRSDRLFKHLLTPPLSFVACWYLNITGFPLVVAFIGAAFISTSLRVVLDTVTSKPVVIPRRM